MNQEYFSIQLSPAINLGIPLESMEAVVQLELKSICVVPGINDFWYGVANFKGSLLWILDSDHYFGLGNQRDAVKRKLTAVIIRYRQEKSPRQIAIVTQKLLGITSLEFNNLETTNSNVSPNLKDCSSLSVITETKSTYILNPGSLFKQLHQQSTLVSA